MKVRSASHGVRSAILVASDPCVAVRRWKIFSGRKAVGCPPLFSIPEILHAVGMLPVFPRPGEELRMLTPLMDECIRLPELFPEGLEEALDWVESVAGWAEAVSGKACTDGALERSIRFYRERDALAAGLEAPSNGASGGFPDPVTLRLVLDSGRFLPVETHTMLLADIFGQELQEDMPPVKADPDDDPLLFLARRGLSARKP